ncbi:MAG: gamma-glutamyltransferase [Actinobacteria bacterium]|nr:gamma-glutamyltransferase [Actinomycetota bacterium]
MSRSISIACATANQFATDAALEVRIAGGSSVDCAIAAQAVICVTMPHASGLGGDLMMLVGDTNRTAAVTGAGRSAIVPNESTGAGASVTVPGLASGWDVAHASWGRLEPLQILEPARRLARGGFRVDNALASAVANQRTRLEANGAAEWSLLDCREGETWIQPELANLLEALAEHGFASFYHGTIATAIVTTARHHGSTLSIGDFAEHRSTISDSTTTPWGSGTLSVQPSPSQGVLLSLAATWADRHADLMTMNTEARQHLLVEATEASFEFRSDAILSGESLLEKELDVDLNIAQNRGGPRGYVHTAGVAVASDDTVISSLVSVFDDFGSCVFVPELGITLNNRGDGFTDGSNRYRPGAFPVHTLAPAIVREGDGSMLALATPGADGQVQTLLQVLSAMRFDGKDVADAIAAPRWRSENGALLIEQSHSARADLAKRGHQIVVRDDGDSIFGAVVAAGNGPRGLIVGADRRRSVVGTTA